MDYIVSDSPSLRAFGYSFICFYEKEKTVKFAEKGCILKVYQDSDSSIMINSIRYLVKEKQKWRGLKFC